MIKNSVGASIEKITVCINDTALTTIINNINNINKDYSLFPLIEDVETYIKDRFKDYLKGIMSFQVTKLLEPSQKKFVHVLALGDRVTKTFINSIGEDFLLSKYLKIKLQTKEQHREAVHDGTSDKETKNSILYEFDIEKYREHTNRNNPIEDVLSIIKMLLFVDINKIFSDEISNEARTLCSLCDEIEKQVNNSIITSLKVTDTLNSSDLLFEDYFYELTQLKMDSFNKVKKINHRKQKVTFRIDSCKQYGKPKTPEEQEEEIINRAERHRNRDIAILELWDDEAQELAEITGALDDCEIKDGWFDNSYIEDEIPSEEDYIENESKLQAKKLKETCKINTVVVFLKSDDADKKGKGIKIDFLVQGALNINKFLFSDEDDTSSVATNIEDNSSPARHSPDLIEELPSMVQEIFDYGLYSFFQNMVDTVDNFNNIERPSFTPYINFIKKNAIDKDKKKQDNLIPKIILAILMDRGDRAFERDILKFFHPTQQKELNTLVTKVDEKIQYYNKEEKRERAISLLYKYFEGKVNAE